MQPRLEVCIDSADGIAACVTGGADRIELCSALSFGGLTPPVGLMRLAAACPIPVRAMIRPVAGGFRYSKADRTQMLADIDAAREAGLEGVVLGAATGAGDLDIEALREFCDRASGMGRTLHRVVDLLPDPVDGVDAAVSLGFDTILTSGGARRAAEGLEKIAAMASRAGGRLAVMPGSGVSAENAVRVVSATGVDWVHSSCSRRKTGNTLHQDHGVTTGQESVTDPTAIGDLVRVLRTLASGRRAAADN